MIKRSQTAIEFLVLVSAVLFFFVVFFLTIGENIQDKTRENINKIVNEIAFLVQEEISFASESVDGYYRVFKIPESLNGLEYDIDVSDGRVYLKTYNNKYAVALPVQDVSGEIIKGENVLRKEGGVIYLNS
ncbi:hypothetical protein HOE04_03455 [archaeon]|jgi:hypothetical protein|nr:hypothetical protein [archaeon]